MEKVATVTGHIQLSTSKFKDLTLDECFISLCIPGARRKHSVSSPACRWGFVSASSPEPPQISRFLPLPHQFTQEVGLFPARASDFGQSLSVRHA